MTSVYELTDGRNAPSPSLSSLAPRPSPPSPPSPRPATFSNSNSILTDPSDQSLPTSAGGSPPHKNMPSPVVTRLSMALATLVLLAAVVVGTTTSSASSSSSSSPSSSTTLDQPNPIAALFPNNVTGVLNVTLAIVPIPFPLARQLIPPGLPILESAYRAALPGFPADMYPVLVQAGHDHDIRVPGFNVDDFSRAGFEFPFVDRLNDGTTPFRWAPEQLIDASNEVAIAGSRMYGTVVHPATFDPPSDAYARSADGGTYFRGTSTTSADSSPAFLDLAFSTAPSSSSPSPPSYPLSTYRTLVNQPIFASPDGQCDRMTRIFDTPLATGAGFEPVAIVGRVRSNLGPFAASAEGVVFESVSGWHVASAFVEDNYLDCAALGGAVGPDGGEL